MDGNQKILTKPQFNTLFSHTGFAVNLTSVFLSIAQFMSGILSINMPTFLQDINYLSPIRYAIRSLAPYTLRDITFTCTDAQRLPSGECPIVDGRQALKLYGLDEDPLWNLIALGICTVVYRGVAWALLRVVRGNWGESRLGRWMRGRNR